MATSQGCSGWPPSLLAQPQMHQRLDESPHKRACGLGDLLPAVVDGERVSASGHLDDLGDGFVSGLELVGGVGQRPGDGVILLS
jgi:hypothetical protein